MLSTFVALSVAGSGLVMPQAGVSAPAMRAAATRSPAIDMREKVSKKLVWVTFADSSECKPNTIISGFRYGQEIAIATESGGKQYALSNKLPPTGQPATFGELSGKGTVTEPISKTEFSLKTGKSIGTWCPSPVGQILIKRIIPPQTVLLYPVRKQGNAVQVLIDINAKAAFESNYWRGILDAQGKVDGGYY